MVFERDQSTLLGRLYLSESTIRIGVCHGQIGAAGTDRLAAAARQLEEKMTAGEHGYWNHKIVRAATLGARAEGAP
jgi:hypothetical protein